MRRWLLATVASLPFALPVAAQPALNNYDVMKASAESTRDLDCAAVTAGG